EIPRAVLLRHQAALQAVGETPHHALQIGKLLVEEAAQAVEFRLVAKIGRLDLLVELAREDLVVDMLGKIRERLVGAAGIARRFRVDILAVVHVVGGSIGGIHFALLALIARIVGFLAFSGIGTFLALVAAFLVLVGIRRLLVVLLFLVARLFLRQLFRHVHGGQHV